MMLRRFAVWIADTDVSGQKIFCFPSTGGSTRRRRSPTDKRQTASSELMRRHGAECWGTPASSPFRDGHLRRQRGARPACPVLRGERGERGELPSRGPRGREVEGQRALCCCARCLPPALPLLRARRRRGPRRASSRRPAAVTSRRRSPDRPRRYRPSRRA